ncbi:MAG: glucoamylase family protein [Limisphaerales bacterium]
MKLWLLPILCCGVAGVALARQTPGAAGIGARTPAAAGPSAAVTNPPPAPQNLTARAGDQSVILHWDGSSDPSVSGYDLYRATSTNTPFARVVSTPLKLLSYSDPAVTNQQTYFYRLRAVNLAGEGPDSETATATPKAFANDNEFLDYVQHAGFDYFWYEANPTNGLIRDRSEPSSFCSIAAVGFGLTAIGVGVDHAWISRAAGRDRTLTTLLTFWNQPQGSNTSNVIGHRGWFYHFLDMNKAVRFGTTELSSIDTALLLAGVLYAKQYFNGAEANEAMIRLLADSILNRVDWAWMANGSQTLDMGWKPESGFIASRWVGYNEGMILYLIGMGAATNPVPASSWGAWAKGYSWRTNYGYSFVNFPPLFGHQYSHCWIDFRHVADAYMKNKGITYFENSRRATLAQRAYAIANPMHYPAYGSNLWGLTACDGPGTGVFFGYAARGTPPPMNDDGTIAPTAAGGSLPFASEYCLPELRHLYDRYRTNIWGVYGFRDAFNLAAGWWDPDVLGIDQGPIVIMVENYRNQGVWRVFMQNPEIQRGLQAAGFTNLAFLRPTLQRAADPGAFSLTWSAVSGRAYQVEFSPDLLGWFFSPIGFLSATGTVSSLSWEDNGPPATDAKPSDAPQRFYRVFEMGGP